jgi:hypothetical protein
VVWALNFCHVGTDPCSNVSIQGRLPQRCGVLFLFILAVWRLTCASIVLRVSSCKFFMSRPRFFKNKNFIMHSWHFAFQDLFQSFDLFFPSKNFVSNTISQILDTKGF